MELFVMSEHRTEHRLAQHTACYATIGVLAIANTAFYATPALRGTIVDCQRNPQGMASVRIHAADRAPLNLGDARITSSGTAYQWRQHVAVHSLRGGILSVGVGEQAVRVSYDDLPQQPKQQQVLTFRSTGSEVTATALPAGADAPISQAVVTFVC